MPPNVHIRRLTTTLRKLIAQTEARVLYASSTNAHLVPSVVILALRLAPIIDASTPRATMVAVLPMMPPAMAAPLTPGIRAAAVGTPAVATPTMGAGAIARPIRQPIIAALAMVLPLVAKLAQQVAGDGAAQRAQNPVPLLVAQERAGAGAQQRCAEPALAFGARRACAEVRVRPGRALAWRARRVAAVHLGCWLIAVDFWDGLGAVDFWYRLVAVQGRRVRVWWVRRDGALLVGRRVWRLLRLWIRRLLRL